MQDTRERILFVNKANAYVGPPLSHWIHTKEGFQFGNMKKLLRSRFFQMYLVKKYMLEQSGSYIMLVVFKRECSEREPLLQVLYLV